MNAQTRRRQKGFTMVELMAMLIIIGLLATGVVIRVAGRIDDARVTTTESNLRSLHNAVNQFQMDTGRWPSEELGLTELIEEPTDVRNWRGPYLEQTELPVDAWGNEFYYERYPESGRPFVIISYGADGEPGGEDLDADLRSTD